MEKITADFNRENIEQICPLIYGYKVEEIKINDGGAESYIEITLTNGTDRKSFWLRYTYIYDFGIEDL